MTPFSTGMSGFVTWAWSTKTPEIKCQVYIVDETYYKLLEVMSFSFNSDP